MVPVESIRTLTVNKCKCGNQIPYRAKVDGEWKSLKNRSRCLTCVPFGTSAYRHKTLEEKRSSNAKKQSRHYFKKKEENGIGPVNARRKERRSWVLGILGGECCLCTYRKCSRNLAFHHVDTKSFSLSELAFSKAWERMRPELSKCIVVCSNCHGEIHGGMVDGSKIEACLARTKDALSDIRSWPTAS